MGGPFFDSPPASRRRRNGDRSLKETAPTASGDIGSLNLWSVSNKRSGGPPQSRCEDDGADSSERSVIRIVEVSSAPHQDLSISPEPFEREGAFLVLLIGCILFVVGLGLK